MTTRVNEAARVVVVGAGHGGATVAALLRQHGFAGAVVLIGDEPVGPYHRPPLSKAFLDDAFEQPLKPQAFYAAHDIELRLSTRVTSIDPARQVVELAGGSVVGYDVLVLATGSVARKLALPGADLEGVHDLRTVADAKVLKNVVRPGGRLAIIGGGYIGLEVAATARRHGVDVTVIEREQRVLARVGSRELSDFLTAQHRRRGTEVLVSAEVERLVGDAAGRASSVVLADGRTVSCDAVLVGVGAAADDGLAHRAGLACEDGVVVDERARAAPNVYAVGDMTRRPLAGRDGLFRLESIPSALEQARQAVAAIVGAPAPKPEVPWFWSDQFELKLQIAGLLLDADAATVRGDVDAGRFAVFHTRGARLVAVEAVNAAADFMAGKNLIRDGRRLDLARLADRSVSLRNVPSPTPVAI